MSKYLYEVWNKETHSTKKVFAIREVNEITQFLTYDFGKWLWLPLDDFMPKYCYSKNQKN